VTTFAADLYLLVAAFGLALPVSYAGLPVLGQGAFVAVGAFGTLLLAGHGTPLLVAVIVAVAIATVAGYLVGYAATRLAGAALALGTWGIAWLAYVVLVQFPRVSGGSQGLTHTAPARLVSPSLGLTVTLHPWVHALVAGIVCAALALVLRHAASGPWGLDWAALRTGPALADSLGVPVQRRRRALLAASGALAALGGAGTAILIGVAAPADYSPLLSLQLFVAVLIGGVATWWGPIVGVALLAALPSTSDNLASAMGADPLRVRAVLTAALLVVALVLRRPAADVVRRLTARLPASWIEWLAAPRRATVETERAAARPTALASRAPVLTLTDVAVHYAGVTALDGVDVDVRAGEVHALVGPNGSGKSTVLRVATGVVAPAAGVVTLYGDAPAPRAGAAAPRVAAGVVRTLQRTALLGPLPAEVQTAVGARVRERVGFAGLRHLFATPQARRLARDRQRLAAAALASVDLGHATGVPADRLDSADQRLLQVARAVATGAPALLLDEPAAGMSARDRQRLARALRTLADDGYGVLFVEHDMALVGTVADRVTVLDAGRVIASGTFAQIQQDAAVRAAYLGQS
jgi:ABC-type branched-subunit amino acid transport system ATPase component/ABC-type branched-subunit amino acid transport system permease subunit